MRSPSLAVTSTFTLLYSILVRVLLFPPSRLFKSPLQLPPSSLRFQNRDPGSPSNHPPAKKKIYIYMVHAFVVFSRRVQHFLPSSARIELCILTLRAIRTCHCVYTWSPLGYLHSRTQPSVFIDTRLTTILHSGRRLWYQNSHGTSINDCATTKIISVPGNQVCTRIIGRCWPASATTRLAVTLRFGMQQSHFRVFYRPPPRRR